MASKLTKNQELILDLLQKSQGHMTAEQINFALKQQGMSLGIATIYRNLNHLYSEEMINRVRHPELGFIYDKNTHRHYHFRCIKCNTIEDVSVPYQSDLHKIVEESLECKVIDHEIIFEGICKHCLKKEAKKN